MKLPDEFRVAAFQPFWRYAVVSLSIDMPGIPYYSRKEAENFFEKAKAEIPWAQIVMIKRRFSWLRFESRVEVIKIHDGSKLSVEQIKETLDEALKSRSKNPYA